MTKSLNIVQLIVELDAKMVMDLLLNQNTDTHEFSPLTDVQIFWPEWKQQQQSTDFLFCLVKPWR